MRLAEPRATLSSNHLRWFYLTRLNHLFRIATFASKHPVLNFGYRAGGNSNFGFKIAGVGAPLTCRSLPHRVCSKINRFASAVGHMASSGQKKLADFGTSNNITISAFTFLINRTKKFLVTYFNSCKFWCSCRGQFRTVFSPT